MDVLKSEKVKKGEIVSIVGDDKLGKSNQSYDENLIGVVSSKRTCTFHLGDESPLYKDTVRLPIALVGKVFLKVNNERGPIKIGDTITSSSSPGIGMKAVDAGKIIGYAMEGEDFKDEELKEILVFVNVCYYVPPKKFRELVSIVQELERKIESKR